MSTEAPKPFAEVAATYLNPETGEPVENSFALVVGGRTVGVGFAPARAEHHANAINAAVEQREAKLRGALRGLVNAVNTHVDGDRDGITRAISAAWDALDGTGPDYVPAVMLEAERQKVKQLQAAIDLLDARESLTAAEVVAVLEAAGLKKRARLEDMSDGDLAARIDVFRQEAERRNWDWPPSARIPWRRPGEPVSMEPNPRRSCGQHNDCDHADRVAYASWCVGALPSPEVHHQRRTCPRCNDMPYQGPSLSCPECGVNRHGVGRGVG